MASKLETTSDGGGSRPRCSLVRYWFLRTGSNTCWSSGATGTFLFWDAGAEIRLKMSHGITPGVKEIYKGKRKAGNDQSKLQFVQHSPVPLSADEVAAVFIQSEQRSAIGWSNQKTGGAHEHYIIVGWFALLSPLYFSLPVLTVVVEALDSSVWSSLINSWTMFSNSDLALGG